MSAQSEMDYVDELRALCSREAEVVIQRGTDEIDAIVELTARYDLLIMGAPPQPHLRDYIRGTPQYRLMRNSACSVLRLKTPPGRTHEGVDSTQPIRAKTGGEPQSLVDFIDLQCVGTRVAFKDKVAAFAHFAGAFSTVLPEQRESSILDAFWDREHSQNTSVGQSVAMPHATIRDASRAFLGVFTSERPIEYQALDGEPVDVFFVTLGPPSERNTHLRILGDLSRLVLQTPLLDRLRAAETPEAILDAFQACEQQTASAK
jgi:mannitol/fructose-specific phosphotransferase system IIA component (Ntr-type)